MSARTSFAAQNLLSHRRDRSGAFGARRAQWSPLRALIDGSHLWPSLAARLERRKSARAPYGLICMVCGARRERKRVEKLREIGLVTRAKLPLRAQIANRRRVASSRVVSLGHLLSRRCSWRRCARGGGRHLRAPCEVARLPWAQLAARRSPSEWAPLSLRATTRSSPEQRVDAMVASTCGAAVAKSPIS